MNELVQDDFLTVYKIIKDFIRGNFKYWILQNAKNHANNYLTRVVKKQKKVIHNDELVNRIPDHHSLGHVDDLLGQHFSEETKQIIILKTIFDYSFQDIAEEMNLSKNRVYRSYKASLPTLKLILEV